MVLLQKIAQRLVLIIQFILVFLFILFEEIIWEEIAVPIYQKVQSLYILQRLQRKLSQQNRYLLLILFLVLLLSVEGAGLFAGFFFIEGKVWIGTLLYFGKIPIAAFTFWMFRVTKKKLLRFEWFAWLYYRLMDGIDWLKAREIYQISIAKFRAVREAIKRVFKNIKEKYFSKESRFVHELKLFYRYLKKFKNRKQP